MELIGKDSKFVKDFLLSIDSMLDVIEFALEHNKPLLNGERFLTGEEVCGILHLSKRTLKEYRDAGKLSFIALPGKILYKESDIRKLLEDSYQKAWRNIL